MSRLTERDEYGNANIIGVDSQDLQLNLEYDQFDDVTSALNRLADFEDMCFDKSGKQVLQAYRIRELAEAEREGRVVVLPCKVGDTVFVLTPDSLEGYEETKINRIVIKKNKMFLNADCKNDDWGSAAWELSPHDFGKKIFLTKSEAARALAATVPTTPRER